MMKIKNFLEHLNIKIVRNEGDNQILCRCPWCGKNKLYVNKTTGLWDCKRSCGSGNPYQLAEKLTKLDSKDILSLLDQYGLSAPDLKAQAQQKAVKVRSRPLLKTGQGRIMTEDEFSAFCEIKGVSQTAYRTAFGVPVRHITKPYALLPFYDPTNLKSACSILQAHLEGKLIKTKHGMAKYPLVYGSRHGLLGLEWLKKEKPKAIIFTEGWRDALAAIATGFYATASSGGTSCTNAVERWLPFFKNKIVYIIFDADEPGQKAAFKIARKLYHVTKEVKIVNLPFEITEDHGKDLCDYINNN